MRYLLSILFLLGGFAFSQTTDNFDSYTDNTYLHDQANWNQENGIMKIIKPAADGEIDIASTTTEISAYHTGSFSDDQYSQCVFVACQAGMTIGVSVRNSGTGAKDYYGWYASTSASYLFKVDNAVYTQFATGSGWTSGDVVRLEVEGTELRCYRNGSLDLSVSGDGKYSDASYSTGQPGLCGYGNSALTKVDDWQGDDVSTTPSYTPNLKPFVNGIEKKPYVDGVLKYVYVGAVVAPVVYTIGINATIQTTDYDGVCPTGGTRLTDADCTSDFPNAYVKELADSSSFGYVKVYIDPDYSGTEAGTLSQPYNAWTDIIPTSFRCYLFKRGSTYSHAANLAITSTDNVIIDAYGTGDRPIIESSASYVSGFMVTYCNDVTIRNLDIRNPSYNNNTSGAIQLIGSYQTDIYNCNLQYWYEALRTQTGGTYRIIGCDIHNIYQNGVFTINVQYSEFAWCHFYNLNEAYFVNQDMQYAAGDGIQYGYQVGDTWFHHSIMDRRGAGNKAGFMFAQTTTMGTSSNAVWDFNTFYAPRRNSLNQGSQVINSDSDVKYTINNNIFYGTDDNSYDQGIYGIDSQSTITGNVFTGLSEAVDYPTGVVMDNNTFYNNTTAIYGNSGTVIESFVNNILWQNTTNYSTGVTFTYTFRNLLTDPDFTDAPNNDFTLQSTSDAINLGATVLGRLYDIVGTEIPQEMALDIGAYEYVP